MTTPEVYPIYFLKKRKLQQDPEDAQAFQYLRALGRMGYMAGPGLAALGGHVSMAELNEMAHSMPSVPMSLLEHHAHHHPHLHLPPHLHLHRHPLDTIPIPTEQRQQQEQQQQHPSEPNSERSSNDV